MSVARAISALLGAKPARCEWSTPCGDSCSEPPEHGLRYCDGHAELSLAETSETPVADPPGVTEHNALTADRETIARLRADIRLERAYSNSLEARLERCPLCGSEAKA